MSLIPRSVVSFVEISLRYTEKFAVSIAVSAVGAAAEIRGVCIPNTAPVSTITRNICTIRIETSAKNIHENMMNIEFNMFYCRGKVATFYV